MRRTVAAPHTRLARTCFAVSEAASRFRTRYGPWALVAGASMGLGAEYARQLAARTLGRLGDPKAVEPLAATLKDADPDVQLAAAQALGISVRKLQYKIKEYQQAGIAVR